MRNLVLSTSFLLVLGHVWCEHRNSIPDPSHPSESSVMRAMGERCSSRESQACLAMELVNFADRMLHTVAVQLSDDVLIVDESDGAAASKPVATETLARAGTSPEDQVQQLVLDKLWNFATTRSLRWRLMDDADLVISGAADKDGNLDVGISIKHARSIDKSRRHRVRNIGPILAAAAMKIGIMGGLAFKGLTLLVGKALLVSKVALLLASIIGLRKLFSQQEN